MSQTPDLSPRAQAILRAIENEARARREGREAPTGAPSAVDRRRSEPPAPTVADAADRLIRLVDYAVAQTDHMRAHITRVEESLDTLSGVLTQPAVPAPVLTRTAAPTPETATAAPKQPRDEVRLIAIEMALSGSSRGEVGMHLLQELGVADPATVLDDVFGAGSADSTRMPWNA
jgi:hypothetical protein